MKRFTLLLVATATAMTLATLPGCRGPADKDSSVTVAEADLAQMLGTAWCTHLARCGAAVSSISCATTFGQVVAAGHAETRARVEPALRAGRSRYNAETARKCLDAIEAQPCSESAFSGYFGYDLDECRHIFEGQVADGAACDPFQQQCGSGSYCSAELSHQCPGVCKPRARVGENPPVEGSSMSSTQCAEGLRLRDKTCVAPLPAGAACGSSVDDLMLCGPGLYCDTKDSHACVRFKAENESCTAQSPCGPWLTCAGGQCRKLGDVGDSCSASSFDIGFPCKVELACIDSRCAERPSEGAVCTDATVCQHGLECIFVTLGAAGTCRAPVKEGADCTRDRCDAATLYCDATSKLCKRRKDPGVACAENEECASALCKSGSCLASEFCAG